jgi:hypothetical protein
MKIMCMRASSNLGSIASALLNAACAFLMILCFAQPFEHSIDVATPQRRVGERKFRIQFSSALESG